MTEVSGCHPVAMTTAPAGKLVLLPLWSSVTSSPPGSPATSVTSAPVWTVIRGWATTASISSWIRTGSSSR
jgi:hypothetical protein